MLMSCVIAIYASAGDPEERLSSLGLNMVLYLLHLFGKLLVILGLWHRPGLSLPHASPLELHTLENSHVLALDVELFHVFGVSVLDGLHIPLQSLLCQTGELLNI